MTRAEALDRYGERTGRDISGFDWYLVFGTWKLAVVLQQIYIRWLRGQTKDERFERMGEVPAMLKAWSDPAFCRGEARPGRAARLDRLEPSSTSRLVAGGPGHPFAATGGRIVATLAKLINGAAVPGRGLISICAAGRPGHHGHLGEVGESQQHLHFLNARQRYRDLPSSGRPNTETP